MGAVMQLSSDHLYIAPCNLINYFCRKKNLMLYGKERINQWILKREHCGASSGKTGPFIPE